MIRAMKRLLRMTPELIVRTILILATISVFDLILGAFFSLRVPGLVWLLIMVALWVPMTISLYTRAGRSDFRFFRKLTRHQELRRWATALWTTPLMMLFPLWLGLFEAPSMLLEHWDLYLLFFGLPFAAAAALYYWSAREGALVS